MSVQAPPSGYETAYFQLTAADIARESETKPFDIVIIGSGIGGGVLAASLLDKNRFLTDSRVDQNSTPGPRRPSMPRTPNVPPAGPQPLRILVVEKGGLLFHTHCLNGSRPSNSGTTSQGNDFFFQTFKHQFDVVDKTEEKWAGGPVFCVGGRANVWGLFSPRIDLHTLKSKFPQEVSQALLDEYYGKAEKMVNLSYPTTLPPHQALIDRLNLRTDPSLPHTQWEWGRVASEFRDSKNYDFAEGAFSTLDKLLEAAMNDPTGKKDKNFRTVPNVSVVRLEPTPRPNEKIEASHVVIKDVKNGDREYKIACKRAVVCAGSIESPAILLRSVNGDASRYGNDFVKSFGHITDHRILAVTSPFFYRNMGDRDVIGGMKLQTDLQFDIRRSGVTVDNTTAIVNISLDGSSFLPRNNASTDDLPVLIIAYILPSDLASGNTIELNNQSEPRITFDWAEDKYLEDKKQVLREFAVDVMNKVVATFDVRFATATSTGYSPILHDITLADIKLNAAGPGVVAHELGSIPLPHKDGSGGILDNHLEMQYGWNNVSVCDLSILPYSAAANPSLTLAALALRLSDKLFDDLRYSPVQVYNLTGKDVVINITNSRPGSHSIGPKFPVRIQSGKKASWRISQREVMYIYSSENAESFDVQMVYPGIDALIVTSPPSDYEA
jgi:choline dehydrogenase-like flavoprotein